MLLTTALQGRDAWGPFPINSGLHDGQQALRDTATRAGCHGPWPPPLRRTQAQPTRGEASRAAAASPPGHTGPSRDLLVTAAPSQKEKGEAGRLPVNDQTAEGGKKGHRSRGSPARPRLLTAHALGSGAEAAVLRPSLARDGPLSLGRNRVRHTRLSAGTTCSGTSPRVCSQEAAWPEGRAQQGLSPAASRQNKAPFAQPTAPPLRHPVLWPPGNEGKGALGLGHAPKSDGPHGRVPVLCSIPCVSQT